MGTSHDPLPPLPTSTRVLLLLLGWILVLVGLAGLVLPGLQGVLTLLLGAALLSLVSRSALRLLRRIFARWPYGWRRLLKLRRRIHRYLHGPVKAQGGDSGSGADTEAGSG